jgi:hypothetical protein
MNCQNPASSRRAGRSEEDTAERGIEHHHRDEAGAALAHPLLTTPNQIDALKQSMAAEPRHQARNPSRARNGLGGARRLGRSCGDQGCTSWSGPLRIQAVAGVMGPTTWP